MTTSEIQSQITQTALQYGVDPALALAVAQKESGFDPAATSPTNANGTTDYGVFQINSSNLNSLGLTNPLDPTQNITAGVKLLSQLQSQYGDNTANILAAYNAGPGAVASGNIPSSTQSYVSSVMSAIPGFSSSLPSGSTADYTPSPDFSTSAQAMVSLAGYDVPLNYVVAGGVGLGILLVWMLATILGALSGRLYRQSFGKVEFRCNTLSFSR